MLNKIEELSLLSTKIENEKDNSGSFVIEPLLPGFGQTVGNSLRRVLLSSLEGSAITSIKIDGASHEFSTIDGVVQDVVEIILNLKKVRLSIDDSEEHVITLDVKGKKKITAADFKCPTQVKIVNKSLFIAETATDKAKLSIEATVRKGRGYLPTEARKEDNLPIGVIAIDALFSPITKVNFNTEYTRVGKMTNFDKLILEIETDGTISPRVAMKQSAEILVDHFSIIGEEKVEKADKEALEEVLGEEIVEEAPKKAKKASASTKVTADKAVKKEEKKASAKSADKSTDKKK